MAVYTQVSAEHLDAHLLHYDVGPLLSAKGIAEGVENSNYLVETGSGRFILTLYERRVNPADLPFFFGLMTHLAGLGVPAPRPIASREGHHVLTLCGRPSCLIEFLTGISVTEPTLAQCAALGTCLAAMHKAGDSFAMTRANALSLDAWRPLADSCAGRLDAIIPGLSDIVDRELDWLAAHWPRHLPEGPIHADLFPDNVLFSGSQISGVIDFYFAATDAYAYDLAVCLNAWCFDPRGMHFHADQAAALLAAYSGRRSLSPAEAAALPVLCRGAAMRFLLTRAYDWINTPPNALVTRKDPRDYLNRLQAFASGQAAL